MLVASLGGKQELQWAEFFLWVAALPCDNDVCCDITTLSVERDPPAGIWRITLGNLKAGDFRIQRGIHVPLEIYNT